MVFRVVASRLGNVPICGLHSVGQHLLPINLNVACRQAASEFLPENVSVKLTCNLSRPVPAHAVR